MLLVHFILLVLLWAWVTVTVFGSPTTFVASANCGAYCGATVDFVDIELIQVNEYEALTNTNAEANGTLPKILIPVHLAGSSAICEISVLAERYGFFVLEDASHAIGGKYGSFPVGNCKYSSITVFSFHPVKIITTARVELQPLMILWLCGCRNYSHGIVRDRERFEDKSSGIWAYEQHCLGFNYRMTDVQAALGLINCGV